MRRCTSLIRKTPLTRQVNSLTDSEKQAYRDAEERARTPDGYLQCEGCGRSLLDREAQRHHIVYRSHGGPTDAGNLAIVCHDCHARVHGLYQPLHPDLAPPHTLRSDPPPIYVVDADGVPDGNRNP